MKICLINNLYKPFARGGAERIIELSAEGLRSKGHEVLIITTQPYLSEKVREPGVKYLKSLYYSLDKLPKYFRFLWHIVNIFDFITANKIARMIKKERIDLVISHNLMGLSYLLPWFLKRKKIEYIHVLHDIQLLHPSGLMLWSHENIIDSFIAKIYQSICRYIFSKCEIVVSPSRWLMDLHCKRSFFLDAKQRIVANPVNIQNNISKRTNSNSRVFKFLFVGQIESHKGIELLLLAFNILRTKYSGKVSLCIVGNGSKFASLKQRYSGNEINFKGAQGRAEVITQMIGHDCLVVPSLCYENSPTVIYEAVSVALPVIAARLGGISELLHELGGVLFNPANANNLSIKMEYLLNNNSKPISNSGQKKIQAYSLDKYINNILSIIS